MGNRLWVTFDRYRLHPPSHRGDSAGPTSRENVEHGATRLARHGEDTIIDFHDFLRLELTLGFMPVVLDNPGVQHHAPTRIVERVVRVRCSLAVSTVKPMSLTAFRDPQNIEMRKLQPRMMSSWPAIRFYHTDILRDVHVSHRLQREAHQTNAAEPPHDEQ